MKVRMYSYRNCSTCKKASKFLNDNGYDFEEIDITTAPPTKKEIRSMIDSYGGEVKKLFNTSGQVYRAKKLSAKIPKMTKDECIEILSKDGKLIKRPFLTIDDHPVRVGYKEEEWLKFFR